MREQDRNALGCLVLCLLFVTLLSVACACGVIVFHA